MNQIIIIIFISLFPFLFVLGKHLQAVLDFVIATAYVEIENVKDEIRLGFVLTEANYHV
jgi:hypothetical protein